MLRLFLVTFAQICIWAKCYGIQFNRYHSATYINKYMQAVAQRYEHVSLHYLGQSGEKRPIFYVTIGKVQNEDSRPAIYINGTHHGNEKASTESALGIIDYLSRKHNEVAIDRLLREFLFVIHPLVNPDGHVKNSRLTQGIDPNRDYPSPFAKTSSFQLNETRLVSKLLRSYNFRASAALHSGIEAVLWPWGSSHVKSSHATSFQVIGQMIAESMKIKKFHQSYHDYKTTGEFIDYAYKNYGTYAFTVEVSKEASPPSSKLPLIVSKSVKGVLTLANGLNLEKKTH